jgi:hypothetical protein
VLGPEARRDANRLRDAQRIGLLQHDVVGGHWIAPFDRPEMRFDPPEPGLVVGETRFDLGAANPQHAAQLVEGRAVVEHAADLVEAQAEITQRQQPMQPRELGHPVRAVSRCRVHRNGSQQSELVVVPQHAGRNVAQAGEVSDAQHDATINRASHSVKVKRKVP